MCTPFSVTAVVGDMMLGAAPLASVASGVLFLQWSVMVGGGHSHERSSERAFRKDLRSLSTRRRWKLLRLPCDPAVGFGGLQLVVLSLLGVVINDDWDVLDGVRENMALDTTRLTGIDWLR